MPRYLADTSAWAQARRRGAPARLREQFDRLLLAGGLATCGPVKWELLHSTNNAEEFRARRADLDALVEAPIEAGDWERVLDVCAQMAAEGSAMHRSIRLHDTLIAVAAGRAGLTVLHYDSDFDRIAGVTGQRCEWIAPRGSL
jgi:predicted nucleic acid-binding protein